MRLASFLLLMIGLSPAPARAQAPLGGLQGLGGENVDIFSIHVVVGPSERDLESVALWVKECEPSDRPAVCGDLMRLLNKDLQLTGLFRMVDPTALIVDRDKESYETTRYQGWFDSGARYLVKGAVRDGKVSLKLHNVLEKGSFRFKNESFPADEKSLVKGVHGFMNELVLALSGQKGLFDSVIWFVAMGAKGTKSVRSCYLDGTGLATLVDNGSVNLFPAPAPGGKVLYTSFLAGLPQIFIGDKRVTHDDLQYRGAQFSPDGKRLAVAVNVDGDGDRESQTDIFLMDPESGRLGKNLTESEADEVTPSWSPDGGQLAFVSNRSGNPHIYVMNADGTGARRLTYAGIYNSTPDWGPNGLIVFTGLDEGNADIFTVDLGGNLRRLTQDQGKNKDPRWGPDGRYITYVSRRSGSWNLYLMTPDGRYQWMIVNGEGDLSTPWW